MEKEKVFVVVYGMKFITGISKKFDADLQRVTDILNKSKISKADRLELLSIYNIAYHESGKIEDTVSCDSTATNCMFCQKMREVAKNNPNHICNYCYDFRQEQYKLHSLNRHSLNLLIMKSVEFKECELKTLVFISDKIRFNSSGDIDNEIQCKNYFRIAKTNGKKHCALWSKNVAVVQSVCKEIGKPKNLCLIWSNPIIDSFPVNPPEFFDYSFTVYSTKETIAKAIESGAMVCNGQKCKNCGFSCYFMRFPFGSNIAELKK